VVADGKCEGVDVLFAVSFLGRLALVGSGDDSDDDDSDDEEDEEEEEEEEEAGDRLIAVVVRMVAFDSRVALTGFGDDSGEESADEEEDDDDDFDRVVVGCTVAADDAVAAFLSRVGSAGGTSGAGGCDWGGSDVVRRGRGL
jgi:hypothetical protein